MNIFSGTFAGNGNSASQQLDTNRGQLVATLQVTGTFGSGTVTLQVSFDNGVTWSNHTGMSFTAAGANTISLAAGALIRISLTGATSPAITFNFAWNTING